jgi:D-glycero-D-manno-heptose 1,7-bisphosphate phosphatase
MRLIILDRDGVINEDSPDYIKSPEEWQPIPGSLEAIAQLNRAGYRVVVVTNQSAIGRGLLDLNTLCRIHDKMAHALADIGGFIEAVFFCPHRPEDNCECRKPKPGLLKDVASRLDMDLTDVPAIGDSLGDLQAAAAVAARPILVRTGKGEATRQAIHGKMDVPVYRDLAEAVDRLLLANI